MKSRDKKWDLVILSLRKNLVEAKKFPQLSTSLTALQNFRLFLNSLTSYVKKSFQALAFVKMSSEMNFIFQNFLFIELTFKLINFRWFWFILQGHFKILFYVKFLAFQAKRLIEASVNCESKSCQKHLPTPVNCISKVFHFNKKKGHGTDSTYQAVKERPITCNISRIWPCMPFTVFKFIFPIEGLMPVSIFFQKNEWI